MANKVVLNECDITIEDKVIKVKYEEDGEIFEDFLSDLVKSLGGKVSINIKTWKPKRTVERKPKHKYMCESCGNEITSNFDNLNIQCKDCEMDYELNG